MLTRTVMDTTANRSRTWTYTYDALGRVLTADGPRTDLADLTEYTYYPIVAADSKSGLLHTITNPLGQITTIGSYNAFGQPLSSTDANGVTTTMTYSPRGWLLTSETGGETTTNEYDDVGQLEKVTLPNGAYLQYTYDAAHRLTDITDQAGNQIHYILNAAGQRMKEEIYDPSSQLAQTRSHVYDTLGRLYQDVGAVAGEATSYGYDDGGNVIAVNDPLGNQTGKSYDALDRLSQVTDVDGHTTRYGYDAHDQLVSVTDPRDLQTVYTIDALGNVMQTQSPDTGTTVSTYDDAGNLKTRRDAKLQTTSYEYDALNRLSLITYADASQVSFTYDQGTDGKGRLTGMTDSSGSTNWSYESHGRVVTKIQRIGSATLTTSYGYNSSGELTSITLPSTNVVGYSWTSGQISAVTINGSALVSSLNFHPFGGPNGWTFADGEAVIRDYNLDGRIVAASLGNLVAPSGTKLYGYDDQSRLTSYTGAGSVSYGYDADGNRTSQTIDGTSSSFSIDLTSNRILSLTYDDNGSVTATGSNNYGYNAAGRLVSANGATYVYDGQGRRAAKTVNSNTILFSYDEAGHLQGEYTSNGHLIQEHLWLGDLPIAVIRPDGSTIKKYFVHADHLGSPREIDDESGNAVWQWEIQTFGENPPNQDPRSTGTSFVYNLRHPGQYADAETNLYQNWHREYDATLGRYIESDPIGLRGGLNTYAYARDNPLSFTDRRGLEVGGAYGAIYRADQDPSPSGDWGPSKCSYYSTQCQKTGCKGDAYACSAKKCCEAFGDNPSSNCTRKCLIETDQAECGGLTGDARNHCRFWAHVKCYSSCGNVNDLAKKPWSLPECQDAMKGMGGVTGGYFQ